MSEQRRRSAPKRAKARKVTPDVSAAAIEGSFRPRARGGLASVELDGETVLYDEDTGRTHVLNPTASLLWKIFDGEASLDELADDVADVFGEDVETVRPQLVELARDLGQQGLLVGVAAEHWDPVSIAHTEPAPCADDASDTKEAEELP
jgi:hypothetical protein